MRSDLRRACLGVPMHAERARHSSFRRVATIARPDAVDDDRHQRLDRGALAPERQCIPHGAHVLGADEIAQRLDDSALLQAWRASAIFASTARRHLTYSARPIRPSSRSSPARAWWPRGARSAPRAAASGRSRSMWRSAASSRDSRAITRRSMKSSSRPPRRMNCAQRSGPFSAGRA